MENFATIDDLSVLWRKMTTEEIERAEALLTVVSNRLRYEAEKIGQDLDSKVNESETYKEVVKSVTCDVVARTMMTSTDQEPMIQSAESALGYSYSGTYLVPGGGIFIKDNELKALGLKRQRYGAVEIYEQD